MGAIYYHLTELETARRRGIAVVLVINNNWGFNRGGRTSSASKAISWATCANFSGSGRQLFLTWRGCLGCAEFVLRSRRRSRRR